MADGTVSFKSVQNENLFQQQGCLFQSETKVHLTVAYTNKSIMHLTYNVFYGVTIQFKKLQTN